MTNQKDYPDLGSDASSVYGISVLVSHTSFCRETSGGVLKCQLFSQAKKICEGRVLFQKKLWYCVAGGVKHLRLVLSTESVIN